MKPTTETLSDSYGTFEVTRPENFIDTPVVSVVMSIYNGRQYLRDAVDSILNQTCKDFEFIIINDGSTDDTADMLAEYRKTDNRLLIAAQENIGLTHSLNRAIRLARGEFIARQDVDDISAPQRLDKQLSYIKTDPELAAVGCLRDILGDDGIVRKTRNPKFSRAGIKRFLRHSNLFMHGEVLMRKSCLEEVGLYREFFRHAQDYDLWLRLSEHFDLDIVPEPLYAYRITADAISISRRQTQENYAQIARKLQQERLKNGADSYNSLVSAYPDGLIVKTESDRCEYHLRLALEFINDNNFINARKHLREAQQLQCPPRRTARLYLKILLGARLLNIIRTLKNLKYRI